EGDAVKITEHRIRRIDARTGSTHVGHHRFLESPAFAACGLAIFASSYPTFSRAFPSRSQTPVWERTPRNSVSHGRAQPELRGRRSQTGVWERELSGEYSAFGP